MPVLFLIAKQTAAESLWIDGKATRRLVDRVYRDAKRPNAECPLTGGRGEPVHNFDRLGNNIQLSRFWAVQYSAV